MTSYEEVHPPEDGERKVQAPEPPKRRGDEKKKLTPALDAALPVPNKPDRYAVPAHKTLRWVWFGEQWRLERLYGNRSWGDAVGALGAEYRKNLRGGNVEVKVSVIPQAKGKWIAEGLSAVLQQKAADEWCAVTDIFERELRERHGEFYQRFSKGMRGAPDGYIPHSMTGAEWLDQRLLHLGTHQYDAMAEYLKRLPEWDGVDRLTT